MPKKIKKLLLTSAWFLNKEIAEVFLRELAKKPGACNVLLITGALTKEEAYYIEESKKELEELGFNNIFVDRYHIPRIKFSLSQYVNI